MLDQSRKLLLRVAERHFKGLFGGGWIAGFDFGDFAVEAVEERHGLADLFPLSFGRAAESGAQREFIVAAEAIENGGGEFAEIADAAFDFDDLRGMEWRIGGSCDDAGGAVGCDD